MTLLRCRSCCMPNTRPDTPFVDGECQACINHKRRPAIDWEARHKSLLALLDRHDGRVLVPSSGGKDSTYQVLTLLELGADVTVVTARTCQLTPIGRANIDNLARYARTIEVVPNMTVRAKLNRLGLELVGDISWPEHAAIFSTPFRVAVETGHRLIMYGENPQDCYGGPQGSEEAMQMTRRWVTEFGGFLGLRPADFVGMEGITERDMQDYEPPPTWALFNQHDKAIEAHFLGQYIPWDSRRNADVAKKAGMRTMGGVPCLGNWWEAENMDNAQTGIHDWFAWLKFGYSRGCAQISVDVRNGLLDREHALSTLWWVLGAQTNFPYQYAGVHWEEVLDRIGMTRAQFRECERRFTNREIHKPCSI
jgi:hypothetical protein